MSRIDEIDHAKMGMKFAVLDRPTPNPVRRVVRFDLAMRRMQGYQIHLMVSFFMKLPPDARLVRIAHDDHTERTFLFIESSEFPEVDDLGECVLGTIKIHREFGPGDSIVDSVADVSWGDH